VPSKSADSATAFHQARVQELKPNLVNPGFLACGDKPECAGVDIDQFAGLGVFCIVDTTSLDVTAVTLVEY